MLTAASVSDTTFTTRWAKTAALSTATLLDLARRSGSDAFAWSVLVAIGVVSAVGVYILGGSVPPETSQPAEVAVSRS